MTANRQPAFDSRAKQLADTIEAMIDAKIVFAFERAANPQGARRMAECVSESRADLVELLNGML